MIAPAYSSFCFFSFSCSMPFFLNNVDILIRSIYEKEKCFFFVIFISFSPSHFRKAILELTKVQVKNNSTITTITNKIIDITP